MQGKKGKSYLIPLIFLIFLLSPAALLFAVDFCPPDKFSTEITIEHSRHPRNPTAGIQQDTIDIKATLVSINKETGEKVPLPNLELVLDVTLAGKFLMEQDGTYILSDTPSPFIMTTDDEGSVILPSIVTNTPLLEQRVDPRKISYTITASYTPKQNMPYIGSVKTENYTPSEMPLVSLAACLPLVLVLGLLMMAMYASGRDPFAVMDISKFSFRGPQIRRGQVKGRSISLPIAAVAKPVTSVANLALSGAVAGAGWVLSKTARGTAWGLKQLGEPHGLFIGAIKREAAKPPASMGVKALRAVRNVGFAVVLPFTLAGKALSAGGQALVSKKKIPLKTAAGEVLMPGKTKETGLIPAVETLVSGMARKIGVRSPKESAREVWRSVREIRAMPKSLLAGYGVRMQSVSSRMAVASQFYIGGIPGAYELAADKGFADVLYVAGIVTPVGGLTPANKNERTKFADKVIKGELGFDELKKMIPTDRVKDYAEQRGYDLKGMPKEEKAKVLERARTDLATTILCAAGNLKYNEALDNTNKIGGRLGRELKHVFTKSELKALEKVPKMQDGELVKAMVVSGKSADDKEAAETLKVSRMGINEVIKEYHLTGMLSQVRSEAIGKISDAKKIVKSVEWDRELFYSNLVSRFTGCRLSDEQFDNLKSMARDALKANPDLEEKMNVFRSITSIDTTGMTKEQIAGKLEDTAKFFTKKDHILGLIPLGTKGEKAADLLLEFNKASEEVKKNAEYHNEFEKLVNIDVDKSIIPALDPKAFSTVLKNYPEIKSTRDSLSEAVNNDSTIRAMAAGDARSPEQVQVLADYIESKGEKAMANKIMDAGEISAEARAWLRNEVPDSIKYFVKDRVKDFDEILNDAKNLAPAGMGIDDYTKLVYGKASDVNGIASSQISKSIEEENIGYNHPWRLSSTNDAAGVNLEAKGERLAGELKEYKEAGKATRMDKEFVEAANEFGSTRLSQERLDQETMRLYSAREPHAAGAENTAKAESVDGKIKEINAAITTLPGYAGKEDVPELAELIRTTANPSEQRVKDKSFEVTLADGREAIKYESRAEAEDRLYSLVSALKKGTGTMGGGKPVGFEMKMDDRGNVELSVPSTGVKLRLEGSTIVAERAGTEAGKEAAIESVEKLGVHSANA